MQTATLQVNLGSRSYPIHIGPGLLRDEALLGRALGEGRVAIISNSTVAPLYLECLRAPLGERVALVKILPDGEEHKNLEVLSGIYDALIDARCERSCTLVALGGGVVGDITGFAAATWQRGVPFVQVPTTLLAQVDSSVGGKTAVNHPRGKNMIGAFHQPRCVIADTDTLATLPPREYAAGLAEALKYGLIADAPFHRWILANAAALAARDASLLAELIFRSCDNKARVVAADEREEEGGVRALLNFGHTFGHALEAATQYRQYLHGEAVAIGMMLAAGFSHRLGGITPEDVHALRALLLSFGLPVELPEGIGATELLSLMRGDKKSARGRIRLVLLRALGDAVLSTDFDEAELLSFLERAVSSGGER
jgi:3-dehydroquinate synthase